SRPEPRGIGQAVGTLEVRSGGLGLTNRSGAPKRLPEPSVATRSLPAALTISAPKSARVRGISSPSNTGAGRSTSPCSAVSARRPTSQPDRSDRGAYRKTRRTPSSIGQTWPRDQPRETVRQVPRMSERTMSKSGDVLAGLRVSLPDIAATAKVRRPVVSIWRSRYAHGSDPFPAPVAHAGQQPFFAASDVVDWMSRRSLGNNPDFGIEIAVRALRTTGGEIDPGRIPALCALLRVKATTGTRLSELDPEGAIDLADEVDP